VLIPHSQPIVTNLETDAVLGVLNTALLSSGENSAELEQELAKYLNKEHALFTGNGSQAQTLIMQAIGVGPGKEVILPTYVCSKVAKAVEILGAKPIIVDIGDSWLLEPQNVRNKINENTAAIILPHVYGFNAWSEDFLQWGIPVIEDICQSTGSNNANLRTGTYTDFAFTSFHGTKPLAAGEGGMLFVNDSNLFEKIKQIRKSNPLYTLGTEMASALALSIFKQYDKILAKRQEIANIYTANIDQSLVEHYKSGTLKSMSFRYILKSNGNFDAIRIAYLNEGIHVRKGVDSLVHREFKFADNEFPKSVKAFETTVSIPILPHLTAEQVNHIVETTNKLHKAGVL
jgi:dTDP-4-amino-4,6-dideoxygalactose transaminase